jgi:hypothetical protein
MELQSLAFSATILTTKHVRLRKQKDKETLTSVLKEMAQPRFAKSARKKEEETNGERTEGVNNEHSGILSSRRD